MPRIDSSIVFCRRHSRSSGAKGFASDACIFLASFSVNFLPPKNKIAQCTAIGNKNVRIVVGWVLVLEMLQQSLVVKALLIMRGVKHIIVVR